MRVLITGITGFVGPYLAEHVAEVSPKAGICGLSWGVLDEDVRQLLEPRVDLIPGDVTDPRSLHEAFESARPDIVFHLAAASSVFQSWSHAARCFEVNALGTVHLFEAMRSLGIAPFTVVASSADVYGMAGDRLVTEDTPMQPISPYGVSKAALELTSYQYFKGSGIPTVRLRLFSHTGPRRPAQFVASSFAKQIAEIERGLQSPLLKVGNLEIQRDFTDVRDVVRAYWLASIRGEPGAAYNVCSGQTVRISELLDQLLALTDRQVEIVVDQHRVRQTEIPNLAGDGSRFSDHTGWKPIIPLRQTLADLLAWWRVEISRRS